MACVLQAPGDLSRIDRKATMRFIKGSAAIALVVLTLISGAAIPASAASASVVASPASSVAVATSAYESAVALRTSVSTLLNRYLVDYGSRLNSADRARMGALVKDADRELGIVEARTGATARLARRGVPRATVYRSAKAAEAAFTTAQAKALTTIDEVQPLLSSKLGFFEALSAKGDLDSQLGRYDALGTRIRAVSAAYAQ